MSPKKPILYFVGISPPVRAVVLTAAEIGLELEIREIDFTVAEHLSEEFVKINPQHTVPTLDDDGIILYDSHVICAYLVDKYAKDDKLYPKDLVKRSLIDTRLYFEAGYMYPRLRFIVEPVLYTEEENQYSLEKISLLRKSYDILEAFLQNGDYVCGDQMTIADFSLIAIVANLEIFIPFDKELHPKTLAWIKRMEQLPYYDEANKKGALECQQFYIEAEKAKRDSEDLIQF